MPECPCAQEVNARECMPEAVLSPPFQTLRAFTRLTSLVFSSLVTARARPVSDKGLLDAFNLMCDPSRSGIPWLEWLALPGIEARSGARNG